MIYAFQKIAGTSSAAGAAGIFCASVLIWIEAEAVAVFWLVDCRRRLTALASAVFSTVVAWLASGWIGELWFRPRPFVDLTGVKSLIGSPFTEKSFPSDHATIAFAMATAVYMVDRRWGAGLYAVAAFVALGRVFVGVHYLSDVAVGAVLGTLVAAAVHFLVHKILHTAHRRRNTGIKN